VNTFGRMCGTIDPESCIRSVLGFGVKTRFDKSGTTLTRLAFLIRLALLRSTWLWYNSDTPDFKAKPNAHSMCAQKSSLRIPYRKYKITNVTIYNSYYRIMSYKRLC
jgi:hypothetical protein